MARILGFQYGEMRGKLGGNVFSRNKAGAYVRAKVTPVNPQTVRQQTARYRFGNMSILYQNLSSAAKDCWQVFASTHFNPLKGNNTGIYTGGNAFVALRQSAGQGNQYRQTPTSIQGATDFIFTTGPYNEAVEPPDAPSSATIKDENGLARLFNIVVNSVDANGNVNYGIVFPSGETAPTTTYDKFENAEGQQFGISFYASNNLKFEGAKPNTALKINFADSGVVSNIEEDGGNDRPTIGDTLIVTASGNVDKDNTRDFPCSGDIVLITPVLRTIDGAQKLLSPSYVTVTDAA